MIPVIEHPWNVTVAEARDIQNRLKSRLTLTPLKKLPDTLAAVDVSYTRWDHMGYAVLGIYRIEYDNEARPAALKELLIETLTGTVEFPYVPGYLSFREIPMLLPLFRRIDMEIDLIITDGVGIAHPRGIGLASHLGLLFDKPSIGCAKSKLIGNYQEPGPEKGDFSDLLWKERVIGAVLRSKRNCKPLFISPGNRCSIEDARTIVESLCFNCRLCEPIRLADNISKQVRKSVKTERRSA
jgi:deoxyribonuclease V